MIWLTLCRAAETTGAVILAGAGSFQLYADPRSVPWPRSERRWIWSAWLLTVVAGGLRLWLTAAEMSDQPPADAWSPALWRTTLMQTRFGAAWLVRISALELLAGWLGWPEGQRARIGRWIFGCLVAVTLLAPQWTSHAAMTDRGTWLPLANALHVLAVGVWPGGLPFLALRLARARREPGLLSGTVQTVRRFSAVSVAAVGGLAFTGLANTWGLVGTWANLTGTIYGKLLLLKVTLFAGMVALGALNRRKIERFNQAGARSATLRTLWTNVAAECALAVLVLTATEFLAAVTPPSPP